MELDILNGWPRNMMRGCGAALNTPFQSKLAAVVFLALVAPSCAQAYDASRLLLGSGKGSVTCHLQYTTQIEPIHYPTSGEIENGDDVRLRIERHFSGLGIEALRSKTARKQLKTELIEWAQVDALSSGDKHHAGDRHRMLLPIIVAYAHNKSAFTPDEQATVEAWLTGLVDEIASSGEMRSTPKHHNIIYLHGSVQMALGIATNDKTRVEKGVKAFNWGMAGIRSNGSFANDSDRGKYGIHYQNASLASLVTIAEMAENQGIDLYGNGGSEKLAQAIDFLLAATTNPSMIRSTGEVKRDWKTNDNAEWAYYWLERFPDSPESAEITRDIDYVRKNWIGTYALVGGSAGCFTRS